jgi:hypothetical protein
MMQSLQSQDARFAARIRVACSHCPTRTDHG